MSDAEKNMLIEGLFDTQVRLDEAIDERDELRAEVERLRSALRQISRWDMINPPYPGLLADAVWLRKLVDDALASPSEGEARPEKETDASVSNAGSATEGTSVGRDAEGPLDPQGGAVGQAAGDRPGLPARSPAPVPDGSGPFRLLEMCPTCHGERVIEREGSPDGEGLERCSTCDGYGHVPCPNGSVTPSSSDEGKGTP